MQAIVGRGAGTQAPIRDGRERSAGGALRLHAPAQYLLCAAPAGETARPDPTPRVPSQ